MSFWSRLFGSAKRVQSNCTDSTQSNSDADLDRGGADCGFCGQQRIESDASARYLYPVWKCTCGAVGSGAWLPDLDEVGDQLLEMLGIHSRVSEPCVSTDHPAITMQHYDVNKVEHDMAEILKIHGYQFRVVPGGNPNERSFWAKRINEKA